MKQVKELKLQLYNSYGAFSAKYFNILKHMSEKNSFTLSEITKSLGYSFKMVTTLVNDYINCFSVENAVYKLKPEYKKLFSSIKNMHDFNNYYWFNSDTSLDKQSLSLDELTNEMQKFVNLFSNHKPELDHVSCTPQTAVLRAIKLANDFDVEHCNILFVGDHDLTSVALKLVNPKAKATVIDIDNDVLNTINKINNEKGFDILTIYNDFRLPAPQNLESAFDVVFTDPPYTPDGMDLFINKSIYFLKKNVYSSILCAYGSAEQSTTIGYAVQKIFSNSFLYLDEMFPKFNEYNFAEAIGYRADLYVFRLTPNSWKKRKNLNNFKSNIYTHGEQSVEAKNKEYGFVLEEYLKHSDIENSILITSQNLKDKRMKTDTIQSFMQNSFNNRKRYNEIFVVIDNTFKFSITQILLLLNTNTINLFTQKNILINENYNLINDIFNIKKLETKSSLEHYILTRKNDNELLYEFYNNKFSKSINALVNAKLPSNNLTKNQLREVFNTSSIGKFADLNTIYIPTRLCLEFNKYIKNLNLNN